MIDAVSFPPLLDFRPTDATNKRKTHFLATLPVYNEAKALPESVARLVRTLDQSGVEYDIAIAEDGSTDGTKAILPKLAESLPISFLQSAPQRMGRGWALKALWTRIDADYYGFSDTDFAANPDYLIQALRQAERGFDVVVGSRYVGGASVNRPPVRDTVSRLYNGLIRAAFNDEVLDHQCGLKVFSRKAIKQILSFTKEDSWFWDAEALVVAHRLKLTVREIPVRWVEKKSVRTPMMRLFSDVVIHGGGLLRLKARIGAVHPPTIAPTARADRYIEAGVETGQPDMRR